MIRKVLPSIFWFLELYNTEILERINNKSYFRLGLLWFLDFQRKIWQVFNFECSGIDCQILPFCEKLNLKVHIFYSYTTETCNNRKVELFQALYFFQTVARTWGWACVGLTWRIGWPIGALQSHSHNIQSRARNFRGNLKRLSQALWYYSKNTLFRENTVLESLPNLEDF